MRKALFLFGATLCLAAGQLSAAVISPLDFTGVKLFSLGGPVSVYFAGSSAAYTSTLSVFSPTTSAEFFNSKTTPVGSMLNLGTFAAGQEVEFRLRVTETNGTVRNYFTGPGSRNPDGIVHAATASWGADASIPVNGVYVGWEDFFRGGDRDYNDHQFVFVGLVPEPGTYALIGTALAGLFIARRRKSA